MTGIVKTIEIEGRQGVALFDTGAIYSYVRSSLAQEVPSRAMIPPARIALGRREIKIQKLCLIEGKIDGLAFLADAVPVEDLGHADGNETDAIIGARTMEQWEIRLDPKTGVLDLEGLRRRKFTNKVKLMAYRLLQRNAE